MAINTYKCKYCVLVKALVAALYKLTQTYQTILGTWEEKAGYKMKGVRMGRQEILVTECHLHWQSLWHNQS